MKAFRFAALLFAGALAGCQLVAPPSDLCLTDRDCPNSGEICRAGTCVHDAACAPRCGDRACGPDGCGGFCGACGENQACDDGRCVPACNAEGARCGLDHCNPNTGVCRCDDTSCPANTVCNHELGDLCTECRSPDDCDGMPCQDGRCAGCANDDGCDFPGSPGARCIGGRCFACGKDSDCPGAAHRCIAHACVACDKDADCGTGHVCDGNACYEGTCRRDGDGRCPNEAPHCLAAGNVANCVQCTGNGDCGGAKVCNAEHVCIDPPQCTGTGHANCPNDYERCVAGACRRCAGNADCPGDATCDTSGECVGGGVRCEYDHDCRNNAAGHHCLAGICMCQTTADCGFGVCDTAGSHACVACTASDTSQCPSDKPACTTSHTCVECLNQAGCLGKPGGRTSCNVATNTCVVPKPCPVGRCGASEDDGFGGIQSCTSNCSLGNSCNASGQCVPASSGPKEGDPCHLDADCGTGLKCQLAVFPGSEQVATSQRPGICVPAATNATCPANYLVRGPLCVKTCTADSGCSLAAFCGTERSTGTGRVCLAGCRPGSCNAGLTCDPFSHLCMSTVGASTAGTTVCTPGVGACMGGQSCLGLSQNGICAVGCLSSRSANCAGLCIPGATMDSGVCQLQGPPIPPPTCATDGDCPRDTLCELSTHSCQPACDRTTGVAVAAGVTCIPGTCTRTTGGGWKEAAQEFGVCQPTRVGMACNASTPCAANEECRWQDSQGTGFCVHKYTLQSTCNAACPSALGQVCVPDPDATVSGPFVCTKACTTPTQCAATLTCQAGGCQPACGTSAQVCVADAGAAYSCQAAAGPTGFRCQKTTGATLLGNGSACSTSAECRSGLCASLPYAVGGGLRCRASCAWADQTCPTENGTVCLVGSGSTSGACAIAGNTGIDGPCASSDDCTSGLVCWVKSATNTGTCRPACRVGGGADAGMTFPSCDPGTTCTGFDPSATWPGGACVSGTTTGGGTAPAWCPTSNVNESCNFCDDNQNGQVDDGLGSPTTTGLFMSSGGTAIDVATMRLDPANAGGGFVTVYVADYADRVEIRTMTWVPQGSPSNALLETIAKNARSLVAGPHLSVVGPFDDHAPPSVYVAYRFFTTDPGTTFKRFFLGSTGWDSTFAPSPGLVTPTGNPGANVRLSVLRSGATRLVGAAYTDSPNTGGLFAWVWCTSGCAGQAAQPVATGLGSYAAAPSDLALVPNPDGSTGWTAFYATTYGVGYAGFKWTGSSVTTTSPSVLTGSPVAQALQAVSFPANGRVVLVTSGANMQSTSLDANFAASPWTTLDHAKAPFALAPVLGVGTPWALLAYVDTGIGSDQLHYGGIAISDGRLTIRHPLLAPGTATGVSIAHDGLRLGATGLTPAGLTTGCP